MYNNQLDALFFLSLLYWIYLLPSTQQKIGYNGFYNEMFRLTRVIVRLCSIQERVTVVLQSIPKEAFAASFQKLYELCQQCVVKDGDYFKGHTRYNYSRVQQEKSALCSALLLSRYRIDYKNIRT
jgi:hypothetical protein